MPSINPAIVVIGVFNSWEIFAIKLRRAFSLMARESAIELNAWASSPISSRLWTGTRTLKSPSPNARAALAMRWSGFVKLYVKAQTAQNVIKKAASAANRRA